MNNDRAPSTDTVPGANAGPDAPSKAKRDQGKAGGDFPSRSKIVGKPPEMKSAKKKKAQAPPRDLSAPVPIGGGLLGAGDVHAPAAAASADASSMIIEPPSPDESKTLADAYAFGPPPPLAMMATGAATRAADLIIPMRGAARAPAVVDSAEAASKDGDGDAKMTSAVVAPVASTESTELTEAAKLMATAFVESGRGDGFEPLPDEKADAYIKKVYGALKARARDEGTQFRDGNEYAKLARSCQRDIEDKREKAAWKRENTMPKMKNAVLKALEDADALQWLEAGKPVEVAHVEGNIDIWWGKSALEADTEIYRFEFEKDAALWLRSMRGGDAVCGDKIPKQQADGTLGPGSIWYGSFGARWVDPEDDAILLDPRVTQGPVLRKKIGYSGRRVTTAGERLKAGVEEAEAKDAAIATRAAEAAVDRERELRQNAETVGVPLAQTPALDDDPRAALLKWYAGMKK